MTRVSEWYALRSSRQAVHPAERLELFGDAVLAIAATLLVLNLDVPAHVGAGDLRHALYEQRWAFLAVVVGFVEITGSWLIARRFVRMVVGVDHWLSLLWIAAVLTATLIPFSTLALARSFATPDFGYGMLVLTGVTWCALFWALAAHVYAQRRGLIRPELLDSVFRPYLRLFWVALAAWSVAVGVALVLPWVSFCIAIVGYLTGVSPLPPETAATEVASRTHR
jgi:uncharacterized membrane protein